MQSRAAQGMPNRVVGAKIACLDMNLQRNRLQLGISIVVSDPKELDRLREQEVEITKIRIKKMLDAGANVILTTKGVFLVHGTVELKE